jgi:hypothetical protein
MEPEPEFVNFYGAQESTPRILKTKFTKSDSAGILEQSLG